MSNEFTPLSDYESGPQDSKPAQPNQATSVESSSGGKIVRNVALTGLFLSLLLFFTLLKLPQTRVTGLMQSYVQLALDPYGIYLSDRGRELAVWHGFRYTLDHPTLEFADQTRVELDNLIVTPRFAALIQGKMGVNAEIHQGPATINFEGSGRGDKLDANIDLNQVDIGKFGLLSYAASLKGSGTISGNIKFAGTLSDPTTLNGNIDLKLKSLKLDEQSVMGFQLPPLNISDGTVKIEIVAGKLQIKSVQIGKGNDDLVLGMTGDIVLNRFLNASTLNLKTTFALSDKVRQNLSLLDTIMSGAKTSDGRYAYRITGSFGAPQPMPDNGK